MADPANLTHSVWRLAHELSEEVLDLADRPGLRTRTYYACQISDAAVSTLASIAATGGAVPDAGVSIVQYMTELRSARTSLTELSKQLGRAVARGYLSEDDVASVSGKVEELQGAVLMLSFAIRKQTGLQAMRRSA